MLPESLRGNRLLDALPTATQDRLVPSLSGLFVGKEQRTEKDSGEFAFVHFPVDCVLSVLATLSDGETVEVTNVGREGFVEADAALQSRFARRSSYCLIPGRAIRIPLAMFATEIDRADAFGFYVRQSLSARLFATEQFSVCNVKHTVVQRFARWLLMARHRTERDTFDLAHDSLATILGTRSAGVSDAVNELTEAGALNYARAKLSVTNYERLEAVTCECYARTTEVFEDALLPRELTHGEGGRTP